MYKNKYITYIYANHFYHLSFTFDFLQTKNPQFGLRLFSNSNNLVVIKVNFLRLVIFLTPDLVREDGWGLKHRVWGICEPGVGHQLLDIHPTARVHMQEPAEQQRWLSINAKSKRRLGGQQINHQIYLNLFLLRELISYKLLIYAEKKIQTF